MKKILLGSVESDTNIGSEVPEGFEHEEVA